MKRVLVTGDDGYKSLGVRVLANVLRPDFDVTVVATKEQKSGFGGSTKAYGSKAWGMDMIDGVKSYWVDGTPADSMEFAQGCFPEGFDYLISGINWGENIGLSTITASGTGGAAIRGVAVGLAKHAVIMSWLQGTQDANWNHDSSHESTEYFIDHPGSSARYIFDEIIKQEFFSKTFVNVNFPPNQNKEYKLTKFVPSLVDYYKYPVIITPGEYKYDDQMYNMTRETKENVLLDVGAIWSGYISVTPFDIA